jgi:hypothetical protein
LQSRCGHERAGPAAGCPSGCRPGGDSQVTDASMPETLPTIDSRLVREVGRMADGRRITYYAWPDDSESAGGAKDD